MMRTIITTIDGQQVELFPGVVLNRVLLRDQQLDGINLSGSDLRGCFLNETSLVRANLSDCDLREVVFYKADLRGTDLRGSDLADCYWNEVIFDSTTHWPAGFQPPSQSVLKTSTKTTKASTKAATRATTRSTTKSVGTEHEIAAITSELQALTGLEPVKNLLSDLIALQQMNNMLKKATRRSLDISPHLVFTGSPGTGKTTVARILGRAYHAIGALPGQQFVEVGRSDLVAGYVGHTAIQTLKVCKKALGGVLFIDEAYSLMGDEKDFGHEAVETLMTFMENNRGKLAVIIAGYPEEMDRFLGSNPGLRSRFDETVHFPDYTDSELLTILRGDFTRSGMQLGPDTDSGLRSLIKMLRRRDGFGNARELRRITRAVCIQHVRRVGNSPSRHDLITITPEDIPERFEDQLNNRSSLHPARSDGYL